MRYERAVTSLSWIPSEAVEGSTRLAFDAGFTHYDDPPPDHIDDIEELRIADRFRFANVLRAWIEVNNDGAITSAGYSGGGLMGSTTVKVGAVQRTFQAVGLPELRAEPEHGDGSVRFVQTNGGRTGLPAPRHVRRRPFVQLQAPTVWTTLSLTLHADGRSDYAMTGASRFPRHWVYDTSSDLALKSGLADFRDWYRKSFGKHTPWGDADSEAFVTEVESALERSLSSQLMRGAAKPKIRTIAAGETLVRQGDAGTEVFLVLDGVLRVEHNGERLAEYGPGAMLGERAHLDRSGRTSSLIAVTRCRVASVEADQLERSSLEELSAGHRREDSGPAGG